MGFLTQGWVPGTAGWSLLRAGLPKLPAFPSPPLPLLPASFYSLKFNLCSSCCRLRNVPRACPGGAIPGHPWAVPANFLHCQQYQCPLGAGPAKSRFYFSCIECSSWNDQCWDTPGRRKLCPGSGWGSGRPGPYTLCLGRELQVLMQTLTGEGKYGHRIF